MNINQDTRLIDLKVSDLIEILNQNQLPTPTLSPVAQEDEIGGYEVAEKITGYSRQTLYQLKSAGQLPYLSLPSGGVRFSKKTLLQWLLSHKRLTESEAADKALDFEFKRKLRRR
ncbi:MAG: helix-turn-helix domain-containing protein [Pedobacter sp.]|jgi:predicted DNA-binding transcriptional regulator AlpA|uniref:helix-turn-helix transcriptional regulator n=1 Tax=Pedobacter sp. TaxID=1411316 RepID=UPI0035646F49